MSSFRRPAKTLSLGTNETFTVKDFRGFTVFEVNSAGDVKRKGRDIKLP